MEPITLLEGLAWGCLGITLASFVAFFSTPPDRATRDVLLAAVLLFGIAGVLLGMVNTAVTS